MGTGVATAQNYKWANNPVRKVQWDKKSEFEPYFAEQGQESTLLPVDVHQFWLTGPWLTPTQLNQAVFDTD